MKIPIWIRSEYVTYIGNPPFFRLEGCPSEEGRPPWGVLTSREVSITRTPWLWQSAILFFCMCLFSVNFICSFQILLQPSDPFFIAFHQLHSCFFCWACISSLKAGYGSPVCQSFYLAREKWPKPPGNRGFTNTVQGVASQIRNSLFRLIIQLWEFWQAFIFPVYFSYYVLLLFRNHIYTIFKSFM